jgi:hypothetical protein
LYERAPSHEPPERLQEAGANNNYLAAQHLSTSKRQE